MKSPALCVALLMVSFIAVPSMSEEPAGEEKTATCILDEPHMHTSANFCQEYDGDDESIKGCCTATCLGCHTNPADDADLRGQTTWKTILAVLSEIYKQDANTDPASLADLCLDCHDERFSERINHPVEIAYAADGSTELVANPEGPKLICAAGVEEGGQGCMLRCVTCHKVHPSEAAGNQVLGMLRVGSAGSELCLRCHLK